MGAARVGQMFPPRDAVVYLAMQWSTGVWAYGTGSLIDNQHILTCSHNLVDKLNSETHGWATNILFYPGYNQRSSESPPAGGIEVLGGFYSLAYYNGQDSWDVALCRFSQSQVKELGFYFNPIITNESIIQQDVTLTGYPGPGDGEMWFDVEKVEGVNIENNAMIYTNDTWEGNSGSPVYTFNLETETVLQHAIHVTRAAQELRRGILITEKIKKWIDDAKQAPAPVKFQLTGI